MISALITAAGFSARYEKNKMLEPIKGKPLIIRTLERFLACEEIDEIIVTARGADKDKFEELTKELDSNNRYGRRTAS